MRRSWGSSIIPGLESATRQSSRRAVIATLQLRDNLISIRPEPVHPSRTHEFCLHLHEFPFRWRAPLSSAPKDPMVSLTARRFFRTLISGKAKDVVLMNGTFRGNRTTFLVQIMRDLDGTEIRVPVAVFLNLLDLKDCRGPFGGRSGARK